MNRELLGAVGQVLAAIGLVPTLIYLAIQVREQNKANRGASLDFLSTQWTDLIRTMNESADPGLIYLRGLQDFESLDPVSHQRFGAYMLRAFRYRVGLYFHYLDGAMPAPYRESVRRQMEDIVA